MGGALLLLHGDAGPVAHVLVGAGEGVEQGGLAAVGVARQGHLHGAGVVGVVVIGLLVVLQLVDVVPELAAVPLRVRGAGLGGRLRLGLDRADLDLARVLLPQRQLIAPQGHLQRVPQGGDFGDLHHRPRGQTHVHQPPLHRARLVAHGYDHAALPGRELLESAGLGFFGVIHSKRCSDPNVSSAPFRSILPERR